MAKCLIACPCLKFFHLGISPRHAVKLSGDVPASNWYDGCTDWTHKNSPLRSVFPLSETTPTTNTNTKTKSLHIAYLKTFWARINVAARIPALADVRQREQHAAAFNEDIHSACILGIISNKKIDRFGLMLIPRQCPGVKLLSLIYRYKDSNANNVY